MSHIPSVKQTVGIILEFYEGCLKVLFVYDGSAAGLRIA